MMTGMRFLPTRRCFSGLRGAVDEPGTVAVVADNQNLALDEAEEESHLLKTVGWISAALGAVALGLIVGRELRERYKFSHQTPYDLYAHSGDELPEADFGVGI
ncbi:MAG TPA: hypothetical protein VG714_00320 [Acidobacteriaceae bacterium]|nr:hypothetical protein [Acidobacteriaceae bacterium]